MTPTFVLAALRVCTASMVRDASARLCRCAQDGGLYRPRTEGRGYDLAQQIARIVSIQGANLVELGFVQDQRLRALGGSRRCVDAVSAPIVRRAAPP